MAGGNGAAVRFAGTSDDEAARLAVLHSYGVLDTAAEPLFDDLTALAADLCGTSMALVSLVDESRQWFKSRVGLDRCETPREQSFCAHALRRSDPLVVPDALLDPRFRDNPMVVEAPFVRFYAGAPLISREGATLGTLCVLDEHPGSLTDRQRRQLTALAGQVTALLESRRQAHELATEVAVRRRTERTMAATDRLLRGVLSHPDALIYAKDLDGRFVLANDALHALFGRTDGWLLGRTDADVVDAAAAAAFRRADREVADTGDRRVLEETLPHPDGTVRHYLSAKFPLRDEDGVVYAVAGVSTDITAQVDAAARLQASERRWRQLFDESPVGIGLSDEHGTIVAANAALCALFGRPAEEVLGATAADFGHPDDVRRQGSTQEMLRAAGGEVVQVEKRYVRPDGEQRWAWLTAARSPGPAGEPWVLAHAQDITERLLAEQVIRDSEANLSAVAEVVAEIQAGSDARETIVRACAELARARYVCLFEPDPADDDLLRVTRTNTPDLAGFVLARVLPSAICRAFDGVDPDPVTERGARSFPAPLASDSNVMVVPVRAGSTVIAVLTLGFDHGVPPAGDKRDNVVRLLAAQAGVAMRQSALLAEFAERAVTDPLTGLPNRRGWDDALVRLSTERRPGERVIVALLDFDRFKLFNDTRGHAAGDDLLRGFADRARRVLRAGDVLARWGGEEFALALPHLEDDHVDVVLRRVAAAMPHGQTCSVGWAELAAGQEIREAMVEADAALYVAKESSRNQIRHF
ncbi:PAS domain-containing protein [Nakamurella deserti]|uniref:PAS domain-containing protein n=1 Tax=Nakamurella deserti TaxID=2164074 RepID=UPI000DBE57FC|nr:PAS domain-containing protein [Nakamurella deserti]